MGSALSRRTRRSGDTFFFLWFGLASVAMMFRHTFRMAEIAAAIDRAIETVLADGYRTGDIHTPGTTLVGTEGMGDRVAAAVREST